MISKGHTKTKAEKDWLDVVVEFGQITNWLGNKYLDFTHEDGMFQIDHIIGAKAKRKVNGITQHVGEFAIMPIPMKFHESGGTHKLNRTERPGNYRKAFGHEKQVWLNMIRAMQDDGYKIPFSEEVIQSIIR
jgi:hypothetical protein